MTTALNKLELTTLAECEAVLDRGFAAFIEVGSSLLKIREQKLYRATHATFDDYVRARWELTARRAYQLCEGASAVDTVKNFTQPPAKESHARELAHVPAGQRAEVWQRVIISAKGGAVTARLVAQVARESGVARKPIVRSDDKTNLRKLKELYRKASPFCRKRFRAFLHVNSETSTLKPQP